MASSNVDTKHLSTEKIENLRANQGDNKSQPLSEGSDRKLRRITVNRDSVYLNDLKKISESEGFEVIESNSADRWLEDHRIALSSGRFLVPTPETYKQEYFSRAGREELSTTERDSNAKLDKQGRVMQLNLAHEYLSNTENLANHHISESYLEGGNVLSNTRSDGSVGVVIGQDSVAISAKILMAKGKFSGGEIDREITKLKEDSNHQNDSWRTLRDTAFENLATAAIAKDLAIGLNQLTIVEQPDYHIDVYLRPVTQNSFLVQDFAKSIEVIDSILSNPTLSGELDKKIIDTVRKVPTVVPGKKIDRLIEIEQPYQVSQREILEQYRDLSEAANNKLGPALERISMQLTEAGYQVIPVAGSFGSNNKQDYQNPTPEINFLNSVTATGDQGKYYITNDTQASPLLKDSFEKMLKSKLGINKVYFAGGSSATTEIISFRAGIDCNTIEE